MHIGFTGTQKGMTVSQIAVVTEVLFTTQPSHVHHGDCIGADANFHALVREVLPKCVIVGHPPTKPDKRAFCEFDEVRALYPYLVRNRHIVDGCGLLLATPDGYRMKLRGSGTWWTVRYADSVNRSRMVISPDGTT